MGAIAARPLWRAVVVSFLGTLSITFTAGAAEIYLGVAPGDSNSTVLPGTLIRASDLDAAGNIVGDFSSAQNIGYGGLAFDSSGNLWATIGMDDTGEQGDESGTLSSTLVRIDTSSGISGGSIAQTIGSVRDSNNNSIGITDLAIHPDTNVLFGVSTISFDGFDPQPCQLCIFTINSTTGIAQSLGTPMQGATNIALDSLAFGTDGATVSLYGTGKPFGDRGQTAYLYTIDPITLEVLNSEAIVRGDTSPLGSSARSFGLAVRPTDGTIFGTLCCTDEIVYRDNVTGKWFNLGQTGGLGTANTYADLAFAPDAIPTPVPASVWLFGSGLAALLGLRRRRG